MEIRRLESLAQREIRALSDVLIDCVEGGASVSFMLPMSRAKAEGYWRSAAASVARGELLLLAAAEAAGTMVGTVQVTFPQPANQPHPAHPPPMPPHLRPRRRPPL